MWLSEVETYISRNCESDSPHATMEVVQSYLYEWSVTSYCRSRDRRRRGAGRCPSRRPALQHERRRGDAPAREGQFAPGTGAGGDVHPDGCDPLVRFADDGYNTDCQCCIRLRIDGVEFRNGKAQALLLGAFFLMPLFATPQFSLAGMMCAAAGAIVLARPLIVPVSEESRRQHLLWGTALLVWAP